MDASAGRLELSGSLVESLDFRGVRLVVWDLTLTLSGHTPQHGE